MWWLKAKPRWSDWVENKPFTSQPAELFELLTHIFSIVGHDTYSRSGHDCYYCKHRHGRIHCFRAWWWGAKSAELFTELCGGVFLRPSPGASHFLWTTALPSLCCLLDIELNVCSLSSNYNSHECMHFKKLTFPVASHYFFLTLLSFRPDFKALTLKNLTAHYVFLSLFQRWLKWTNQPTTNISNMSLPWSNHLGVIPHLVQNLDF